MSGMYLDWSLLTDHQRALYLQYKGYALGQRSSNESASTFAWSKLWNSMSIAEKAGYKVKQIRRII